MTEISQAAGINSKQYCNLDDSHTFYVSTAPTQVRSFFERKIATIRQRRFKVCNLKRYFKLLRRLVHLNKNPKRKGYEKFLTDEEKR